MYSFVLHGYWETTWGQMKKYLMMSYRSMNVALMWWCEFVIILVFRWCHCFFSLFGCINIYEFDYFFNERHLPRDFNFFFFLVRTFWFFSSVRIWKTLVRLLCWIVLYNHSARNYQDYIQKFLARHTQTCVVSLRTVTWITFPRKMNFFHAKHRPCPSWAFPDWQCC